MKFFEEIRTTPVIKKNMPKYFIGVKISPRNIAARIETNNGVK